MKALVYTAPYTLEYTDVADPQIGDDDILVRVKACGICGSDVHGATGKTGRRLPPLIMGHEAAGLVAGLGKNVTGFAEGDRVCFDSTVYCNVCEPCKAGRFNYCVKRQVLGVSIPEFKRHGAFAEFVAVPHWITFKMPDGLPFTEAALLEPASIGAHAANRANILPGQIVAVIGAGTIGLFILQAAKLKDPATLIAIDINNFRLDLAGQLGVEHTIHAETENVTERIAEITAGHGADVTLEAVGFPQTFNAAADVTAQGGRLVAVGNVTQMVEFNLQQLVSKELTFAGSYASAGEFEQCIDLLAAGKIDAKPLISDVVPLADGAAAFDRLLKAEENLLKIVLEP